MSTILAPAATGSVARVAGPVVVARLPGARLYDLVLVGPDRLAGEIIRLDDVTRRIAEELLEHLQDAKHARDEAEAALNSQRNRLAEVERACQARGLRLTPIRAHALRLIAQAGRPLKAYDLLDRMKQTRDAAAPPTVYRALDFLLEHGYCTSLYVEDPNGMILEFTVDHPKAEEINATRLKVAHAELAKWLAGDHTSNNTYR